MDYITFAKKVFVKPTAKGMVSYNQENIEKLIEENHLPSKNMKHELYKNYLNEFQSKVNGMAEIKKPIPKVSNQKPATNEQELNSKIIQTQEALSALLN